MELALTTAATAALGYALSKPEIKIWLPGLPPLEFDNPLFRTREGQRLGSLQIQETAEGAPDNRCFGQKNRVAGALVWMSALQEKKKRESGGGKAGGGGEFITYQYVASAMFRLCRARTPVSRIPTLWADGKVLFNLDTDINYSSAGIDTKVGTSQVWLTTVDPAVILTRRELRLESDTSVSGRPDLSKIKSGSPVRVSGYGGTTITNLQLIATPTTGTTSVQLRAVTSSVALQVDDVLEFAGFDGSYSVLSGVTVGTGGGGTAVSLRNTVEADKPIGTATTPLAVTAKRGAAANNGTFMALASSIDAAPGPPKVSRVRLVDARNPFRLFAQVALGGATVALFQSQPTFKASQLVGVEMLHGGPDQTPPAVLEQFESANVSQVYGMRNRAGCALRELNLTDFGNRVPNIEGMIEVTAEPGLVADCIRTLLVEDAKWPEASLDVSQVSGEFIGYSFRVPQSPNRSLQALMLAFDVVRWERNGKLYFASRSALDELQIQASEIGNYSDDDTARGLIVEDPPKDQLPSEVVVTYRSASNDLQHGARRSKRTEELPADVRTVSLEGLVISDDLGQQIADRLLAVMWGAQRKLTLHLPQSRIGAVRAGMVLYFTGVYGQDWRVFIERVDRGANMRLIAYGQEYDPELLVQDAAAETTLGMSATGNTQDGGHKAAAPVDLLLLDTPPLSDQYRHEPGITVAPSSEDYSRPWRGGILYWSRDNGASWNRVAELVDEAVCGDVVTPPATEVIPGLWDRVNTIRIRIRHPQVQIGTVSEDACLLGSNRWLIGREIIGAARVTFVERDPVDGSRTYDLSVLLRGQHDTERYMDEHEAGETAVWLDGPGIVFLPLSYSHVGMSRLWKLVPHGGMIDDVRSIRFTPSARNARPFHVCDVEGKRNGSNDILLTWRRGLKAATRLFEQGEPLDEETEAYEIDVVVSGTVVRTIATSSATTTYTATQQTSDGITPGDAVSFVIHQMSAALLRGMPTEFEMAAA